MYLDNYGQDDLQCTPFAKNCAHPCNHTECHAAGTASGLRGYPNTECHAAGTVLEFIRGYPNTECHAAGTVLEFRVYPNTECHAAGTASGLRVYPQNHTCICHFFGTVCR